MSALLEAGEVVPQERSCETSSAVTWWLQAHVQELPEGVVEQTPSRTRAAVWVQ